MKASELVAQLQELIEGHGDKPVTCLLCHAPTGDVEWYDKSGNQMGDAFEFVLSPSFKDAD